MSPARFAGNPPTRAKRGPLFEEHPAAMIRREFGSVRQIQMWFCSATIKARSLLLMVGSRGAVGITNRPHSFITSALTMRFLIVYAAASRKAVPRVWPVVVMKVKLLFAI